MSGIISILLKAVIIAFVGYKTDILLGQRDNKYDQRIVETDFEAVANYSL